LDAVADEKFYTFEYKKVFLILVPQETYQMAMLKTQTTSVLRERHGPDA
jgi:hypothetical protein